MSSGYRFSGDALADLRDLDPEVQEVVLDVLEQLVGEPPEFGDEPLEHVEPLGAATLVIRGVWSRKRGTLVVIGVLVG